MWRDELRSRGSWAERVDTPGVDVVELQAGEITFWQVKSTLTPYAHFGRQDRANLRNEARRAGATCSLLWWPKGKSLLQAEVFPEEVWPEGKLAVAARP